MQALVEIAGQQFDVKANDVVKVPHLQGNTGDVVEFNKIFLGKKGKEILIGTPLLDGSVSAKILEHGRDKKVLVFKKKRRKGYQKCNGHRQQFTKINITSINIDDLGFEEVALEDIAIVSEPVVEADVNLEDTTVEKEILVVKDKDVEAIEEEVQEEVIQETDVIVEEDKVTEKEILTFDDTVISDEDTLDSEEENK